MIQCRKGYQMQSADAGRLSFRLFTRELDTALINELVCQTILCLKIFSPDQRSELQQLNSKNPALKLNSTNFTQYCTRVKPLEARRGGSQNNINLVISGHCIDNL